VARFNEVRSLVCDVGVFRIITLSLLKLFRSNYPFCVFYTHIIDYQIVAETPSGDLTDCFSSTSNKRMLEPLFFFLL